MAGLHFPTALLIIGLLFILMPAIAWLILNKRGSKAVTLFCAGGMALGAGLIMIGMRNALPLWVTYTLANFLIMLGSLIRIQAFHIELDRAWKPSTPWILSALFILIFELIRQGLGSDQLRMQFATLIFSTTFLYCTAVTWQFSRRFNNRSALWIALVTLLIGVGFIVRFFEVSFATGAVDGADSTPGTSFHALVAILSAVISHLAYVGMKLEQEHIKLEKAEHEYAGILRTTKDGFFIIDAEGRFVDINDMFCEMVGRSREQLLACRLQDVDASLSPDELQQKLNTLATSGFDRFETRHKCSDGRQIDVEVSVTFLQDDDGLLLGFVRDISMRKQFQLELERRVLARTEELATARAEAESANAVKTRFMSNVSHEMRTPLQGILGFAELGRAKSAKLSGEELAHYFDRILESGKRMQKLVESLLHLVQEAWDEESGVAEEDMHVIEPEALVSQCISLMEKHAHERGQQIVLESQTSISRIQGDEPRLRQVLEHLITNAMLYSPEKTTITLRLLDRSDTYGVVKQLVIQVLDQGCGVPESEQQAIFEPFYQSSRTATGAGGTGLGLPLCKSIIQRHKGSLSVSNLPQGGAMFEITLPPV